MIKRFKKLYAILVSFILLVTVGVTGCGNKDSKSALDSNGKKLFVINMPTQTGYNEFWIADKLGYFKDEGIKINYTGVLKGNITEVQSVLTGSNDVFTDHPSSVIQAILAGAKIKIVAPGMVDNKKFVHMGYLVKDNGPYKTAADLKGKKLKVAVSGTNTCTDIIAMEWFRQHGISKQNVNFVIMPDEQIEQAVKQGLVDIGCVHPPYTKKAQNDGGTRQLFTSYDAVHGPSAGASIRGFSDKFIEQHPEQVAGFTKAIIRAHKWMNTHQDEAMKIEAQKLNIPVKDMAPFWYDESNYVQNLYIQKWIDMMVDDGLLKKGEIKTTDLYTNDYDPYYKGSKYYKNNEKISNKNNQTAKNVAFIQ